MEIWIQEQIEEEDRLNDRKSGGSVYRHPLMFNPPPEDEPKESKSNRSQRTDYKNSTGYMIPTRFVGVSFYIKEAS
jgi:hypothetical protein